MADYLSFAGGIPLLDIESLGSEEELNVAELALKEEPIVQFNNLNVAVESLAIAPVHISEVPKKLPKDVAPDKEELIEGSGLYIKCPRILGCLDT